MGIIQKKDVYLQAEQIVIAMEDKEYKTLTMCRMRIGRTGKLMNVFSIFAALGLVFMVVGGIVLLAYGSRIDPDMPNYLTLLISFAGIGLIILAAALVYPIVLMREAVKSAKLVASINDIPPMLDYNSVVAKLWRYMTWFLVVIFSLALIGALVASLVVLSVHNAI